MREVSRLRGSWVSNPIPRQETSDGRDEPSAPAHDRGHDGPQSVAGDAAILPHAVAKFSRYFGRSPDRLDLEDVRAFQVHLVANGISWPALNQTVCALRFFYGVTLGHGEIPERIPYAREPRKLPVVLSADEVVRFLEAVPSLKTRAALTTAYAAGLRASEAVGLKIERHRQRPDGHPGRARQGRQGPLRHAVGATARHPADLLAAGPAAGWLFPGRDATGPIDVQVLHSACRSAPASRPVSTSA